MPHQCDNPKCKYPATTEIPVSVNGSSAERRWVCEACKEAYNWGVEYGCFTINEQPIWLVAIADKGLVAHVSVHASEAAANAALVTALTDYHGYEGGSNVDDLWRWINRRQETLSVEIIQQTGFDEDVAV